MTQYYVGIDLHKSVAQVCVCDAAGEIVAERRIGLSEPADGAALVNFLRPWQPEGRFAVEAVGMNRWLVNTCLEAGMDIVVVDPVKLGLKALGKKTDPVPRAAFASGFGEPPRASPEARTTFPARPCP